MPPIISHNKFLIWPALGAILLFAGYLRYTAVADSYVIWPYRTDAAQYYDYAYNLREHGVYSYQNGINDPATLRPDDFRTPGYPLFLSMFVTQPRVLAATKAIERTTRTIAMWQAVLGTLTVLIVFLVFRAAIPPWVAMCAALLTAFSPHLVNTTIYMLSETLFAFLVVLIALALTLQHKSKKLFIASMLMTGIVIGLAALTRPVLEYFLPCVIFLLFISYARTRAFRGSVILVIGFLLMWGPWVVRNQVSVKNSDNQLMMGTLHQGMYPGLMYDNDPKTLGHPYDFDPHYKADNKDVPSVLLAIAGQFRAHPLQETAWYLLGKPVMLWSWSTLWGGGDIFIYPVLITPYYSGNQTFLITHAFMYGWHWPLVIAALLACVLVWLPVAKRVFDENQLFLLRAMSLLLVYNTGLLMVGSPYPRYSIPFLPILFGMAMAFMYFAYHNLKILRQQSRANYTARLNRKSQ